MIAFDAEGKEGQDDPDGLISQHLIDILKNLVQPITDVFLFGYGWLGDIQDAINQYSKWTKIVCQREKDRDRIRQFQLQFNSLLIGFHWQSKLWGNEELSLFEPELIYNLKSDRYICESDGIVGAHKDIDKPEVAHAIWEAAIAGLL